MIAPGDGELFVRRPGRSSFVALAYGSELPLGTEVDAGKGSIALTSALPGGKVQTATFGGGRFVIRQGREGYVDLYLRGRACPDRAAKGSRVVAGAARTHVEAAGSGAATTVGAIAPTAATATRPCAAPGGWSGTAAPGRSRA